MPFTSSGKIIVPTPDNRDGFGSAWTLTGINALSGMGIGGGSGSGSGMGSSLGAVTSLDIGNNSVTWVDGDAALVFPKTANGTYAKAEADADGNSVTYDSGTYTITSKYGFVNQLNSNGVLTKQTDRNGNFIQYNYSDENLDGIASELSSTVDSQGHQYNYTYSNGLITSITGPDGASTSFIYDGLARLTSVTDQNPSGGGDGGSTTQYVYDQNDLITDVIDALGNDTHYNYDPQTLRLTSIVYSDGTTEQVDPNQGMEFPGYGTDTKPMPMQYLPAGDSAADSGAALAGQTRSTSGRSMLKAIPRSPSPTDSGNRRNRRTPREVPQPTSATLTGSLLKRPIHLRLPAERLA